MAQAVNVAAKQASFSVDSRATRNSFHFVPTRLIGALAAGVDFTQNDVFFERIRVAGASKITAISQLSATAVVGTLSIDLHRMASDATADDTIGTRLAGGGPTTVTQTTASEEDEIVLALDGEEFVEIELTMSAGVSDVAEIGFIDILLTTLS